MKQSLAYSVAALSLLSTITPPALASKKIDDCLGMPIGTSIRVVPAVGLREGCADSFHRLEMRRPELISYANRPYFMDLVPEWDWSNGWGFTDSPTASDKDSPYCLLAEAFSVMERSSVRGSAERPKRFVLSDAYAFTRLWAKQFVPRCTEGGNTDDTANASSGLPNWLRILGYQKVRLYQKFFGMDPANRGGTMLHEAWHRAHTRGHNGSKKNGLSRDKRYIDIYQTDADELEDGGVTTYSIHVNWLEDYISLSNDTGGARRAIRDLLRNRARARGNRILQSRFEDATPKRLPSFTLDDVLKAASTTAEASLSNAVGAEDYAGDGVTEALLPSRAGGACGLIGVYGSFRGEGDYARVVERAETSGTHHGTAQYLQVRTDQNKDSRRSGALALCFPDKSYAVLDKDELFVSGEADDPTKKITISGSPVLASTHTCFLKGIEGRLEGEKDGFGVRIHPEGYWQMYITSNTRDTKNYYRIQVACIDTPFAYPLDTGSRLKPLPNGDLFPHSNTRSDSVLADNATYPDSVLSHACALSRVTGRMYHENDTVEIHELDKTTDDFGNRKRNYLCEDSFAGSGQLCTAWNLSIEGDSHIGNRNATPEAACFAY